MRRAGVSFETLTDEQRLVLETPGDLLVSGRPGTGKTSVALLKAATFLAERKDEGRVLFLSFSKAAVQRIESAARIEVARDVARRLEVSTFHAFCYRVLQSHSAHVGIPSLRGIVLKYEEQILEAECGDLAAGLKRIEEDEGRVSFERLLELCVALFKRNAVLRKAYASAYPLIIVDEYQDCNDLQDELVDLLSSPGQVIYLGDPDQRIYGFMKGVHPDRFERLIARRAPTPIVLPPLSHRAGGSDLTTYSRAVLLGTSIPAKSRDVLVLGYGGGDSLRQKLRQAIGRAEDVVRRAGVDRTPSIAVCAYRNAHTWRLSQKMLETCEKYKFPLRHSLEVGTDEWHVAWDLVFRLLGATPSLSYEAYVVECLSEYARYMRGLGGKGRLKLAEELLAAQASAIAGGPLKPPSLKKWVQRVADTLAAFGGDADLDFRRVVEVLLDAPKNYVGDVEDALRSMLLSREHEALLADLEEAYRSNRYYLGAHKLGMAYLLREALMDGRRVRGGRTVLTMHKSKGKEYDAVVIVDGPAPEDRLVLRKDSAPFEQSRRLLSMTIARARHFVVILTPVYDRCALLPEVEQAVGVIESVE